MKKVLLFGLLTLSFFYCKKDDENNSSSKVTEKYLVDSVHTDYLSTPDIFIDGKEYYTYNNNGFTIKSSFLDLHNEKWSGFQFNNTFNEKGYVTESWSEHLNESNEWKIRFKSTYQYDAKDNQVLFMLSLGNDQTGEIEELEKTESKFNSENKAFESIISRKINNEWRIQYKYTYYTDVKIRNTEKALYNWDEALSKWNISRRYNITVDNNGYPTSSIAQDSFSVVWMNSYKEEYSHSAKGNLLSFASYYWDNEKQSWRGNYKYENLYNSDDNMLEAKYFSWDFASSNWIESEKTEYTYTEEGDLKTRISTYVYAGAQQGQKEENIFDDKKALIRTDVYSLFNNVWKKTTVMTIYSSLHKIIKLETNNNLAISNNLIKEYRKKLNK